MHHLWDPLWQRVSIHLRQPQPVDRPATPFGDLPAPLRHYLVGVWVITFPVVIVALWRWGLPIQTLNWGNFILALILVIGGEAALIESRTTQIVNLAGTGHMISILLLPGAWPVVINGVGVCLFIAIHQRGRGWYKWVYNLGHTTGLVTVAAAVWIVLTRGQGISVLTDPQWAVVTVVAVLLVLWCVDSLFIVSLLSRVEQQSFVALFQAHLAQSFLGEMTTLATGAFVVALWRSSPVLLPLALLPFGAAVAAFFNAERAAYHARALEALLGATEQVRRPERSANALIQELAQALLATPYFRAVAIDLCDEEGQWQRLGATVGAPPPPAGQPLPRDILSAEAQVSNGQVVRVLASVQGRALGDPEECGALLKIFAHQAVIGVQNARLLAQEFAALEAVTAMHRQRADFARSASHELRTPLTTLMGYTDLMLLRWANWDDMKKRQTVELVQQATYRLSRLIDDLNVDALIPDPDDGAAFEAEDGVSVPLCPLVQSVAQEIEFTYDGLDVVVAGEGSAMVDPARFQAALSRILDNAAKHSPPGSPVSIMIEPAPDGYMAVRVSDCGPGISPDDMPRMFQLFERLPGAQMRAGHVGMGVGLVAAKFLCESMGGYITVQSAPGAGATFSLILPAVFPAEVPAAPAEISAATSACPPSSTGLADSVAPVLS